MLECYRSNGECNIFIGVMIINVYITSSLHMHVEEPMRSKLLDEVKKLLVLCLHKGEKNLSNPHLVARTSEEPSN